MELSGIAHLEGTFKDHLVQLCDHFRTNQKLKCVTEGTVQMPVEQSWCTAHLPVPCWDQNSASTSRVEASGKLWVFKLAPDNPKTWHEQLPAYQGCGIIHLWGGQLRANVMACGVGKSPDGQRALQWPTVERDDVQSQSPTEICGSLVPKKSWFAPASAGVLISSQEKLAAKTG